MTTLDVVSSSVATSYTSIRGTTRYFTTNNSATTSTFLDYTSNNPAPAKRGGHQTVYYNGKFYVFAGYAGAGGSFFNDVRYYDPTTQLWTVLSTTNTPSVRYAHHSSVISGNLMITFGGWSGSAFLNDVTTLNLDTGVFSTPSTTGTTPSGRQDHVSDMNGNDMYVFSGLISGSVRTNDLYKLNTGVSPMAWTTLTPSSPPPARTNSNGCFVSGKLYIFGGEGNSGTLNDLWKYDPTNGAQGTWTQLSPSGSIPPARMFCSLFAIGTIIYIFGGTTSSSNAPVMNDFYKYDTVANSWTQITTATVPTGRCFHTATLGSGSNVFIFGGYPNNGLNATGMQDVWYGDYSASPIVHTQLDSGVMTVGSSTFTKKNYIFTTGTTGGKVYVGVQSQLSVATGLSFGFTSIRVQYS